MRFFLLISFLFSGSLFSQKKDTVKYIHVRTRSEIKKCEKLTKKNKKLYSKLAEEAKKIDFTALNEAIINDINAELFKNDIVNVYLGRMRIVCGNDDTSEPDCKTEFNTENPFYNRSKWSVKEIVLLSKKLNNKIIIPSSLARGFYQVLEENDVYFKSFKIGEDKIENKKFYYSSEKIDNFEFKGDQMDTLFLDFKNLLGYKVEVTLKINDKDIIRVYEYFNNEWTLVSEDIR